MFKVHPLFPEMDQPIRIHIKIKRIRNTANNIIYNFVLPKKHAGLRSRIIFLRLHLPQSAPAPTSDHLPAPALDCWSRLEKYFFPTTYLLM